MIESHSHSSGSLKQFLQEKRSIAIGFQQTCKTGLLKDNRRVPLTVSAMMKIGVDILKGLVYLAEKGTLPLNSVCLTRKKLCT